MVFEFLDNLALVSLFGCIFSCSPFDTHHLVVSHYTLLPWMCWALLSFMLHLLPRIPHLTSARILLSFSNQPTCYLLSETFSYLPKLCTPVRICHFLFYIPTYLPIQFNGTYKWVHFLLVRRALLHLLQDYQLRKNRDCGFFFISHSLLFPSCLYSEHLA